MTHFIASLSLDDLDLARGGASSAPRGPTPEQEQQLRQLAQSHCPSTYARVKDKPITRPIAEQCLDEAGYGFFKYRLDRYFPRR